MSKHKISVISLASSLALVGAMFSAPAFAAPGDYQCDIAVGSGTQVDPYLVTSKDDLLEVTDCNDQMNSKYFSQTSNIDLGGSSSPWTPIEYFAGVYDGNDRTISNLYLHAPSSNSPIGLFASTNRGAEIRDLNLTVTKVTGNEAVGALVGNWQGGNISGVTVSPASNSHISTRNATSYSISSNVMTLNIGVGHTVEVGAQFSTGAAPVGPFAQNRSFVVSAVNSGAGTISIPFVGSNTATTSLAQSPSITFVNPLVVGTSGVGGMLGRAYGYYSYDLASQVAFNTVFNVEDISSSVPVFGEEGVGGVVGTSEALRYTDITYFGNVSSFDASSTQDLSAGGVVGRSYNARWRNLNVVASVASSGSGIGGVAGMSDNRGVLPWCALSAGKLISIESSVSGEIEATFASASHGFSAGDTAAFAVSSHSDFGGGVIAEVDAVNGSTVTLSANGSTFSIVNGSFSTWVLKLATNNNVSGGCGMGIDGALVEGKVTAGQDSGYSKAGGAVGSATSAEIKNLSVSSHVYGSGSSVGGVVGLSQQTGFEAVEVTGGSVEGTDNVGGVAGYASGSFRSMTAQYQVRATDLDVSGTIVLGADNVGGLFGHISALNTYNSHSDASVSGDEKIGGLFGYAGSSMTIKDSTYDGDWVFGPTGRVGGIAGALEGAESAVAIASVTSLSPTTLRITTTNPHLYFAGDKAYVLIPSEAIASVATVVQSFSATQFDVTMPNDETITLGGGDTVTDYNAIIDSHVTSVRQVGQAGSIRADSSRIGGLAGSISTTVIEGSSNKLQLRIGLGAGDDGDRIGGLVGTAYSPTVGAGYIKDSYSNANIYFDADFDEVLYVGGLVGDASGYNISRSYFEGSIFALDGISGTSINSAGGIIGMAYDTVVADSYVHGTIDLPVGSAIGGLAGQIYETSLPSGAHGVSGSYFDGSIEVADGAGLGGVAGQSNSPIQFTHATGSLNGDQEVGGLVGTPVFNPDIKASYFDGTLSRTDTITGSEVIGTSNYSGDYSTAYWNSTELTSQLTAGAKTATELSTASTFSLWTDFDDYFEMPTASLTTKPYPVLTALLRAPTALTIGNPATDLNGILPGTNITPISASAWGYPRPVLEASNTLPAGLAVSGFQVTGAPTAGGAYSFTLAARNQAGIGPTTTFSGSVVSLTPPAYSGPVLSEATPTPARPGQKVVITGSSLQTVTALAIAGKSVENLQVTSSSLSFTVPADQKPGVYDLEITSSTGNLTVQSFLKVGTGAVRVSVRKLDGSSAKARVMDLVGNGKVQILVNGREIAWARVSSDATQATQTKGLVRTVGFKDGKNIIEILVDGVRIKRVVYSK